MCVRDPDDPPLTTRQKLRYVAIALCGITLFSAYCTLVLLTFLSIVPKKGSTKVSRDEFFDWGPIAIICAAGIQCMLVEALHVNFIIVNRYTKMCLASGAAYLMIFISVPSSVFMFVAALLTKCIVFYGFILWSIVSQCWSFYVPKIFGCQCEYHQGVPMNKLEFLNVLCSAPADHRTRRIRAEEGSKVVFITYKEEQKRFVGYGSIDEEKLREIFPQLPQSTLLIRRTEIRVDENVQVTKFKIIKNYISVKLSENNILMTIDDLNEDELAKFSERKKGDYKFEIRTPLAEAGAVV